MIRNIHNTIHHHLKAGTAVRQTANRQAETNPFRSILASTDSQASAASPVAAASTPAATPAIIATITKAATPVVTLSPPVFKQDVTVSNPDGSSSPLNYTQFAAPYTAREIAAKLGGVVDDTTMPGISTSQLSIRVPGSNNLVNAGIAAQLFAQYGDKPGSQAWQIINRDIGRDPMST